MVIRVYEFTSKKLQQNDLDISVIKSDVFKFLEKVKPSYDIIFCWIHPYDLSQENFEKNHSTYF